MSLALVLTLFASGTSLLLAWVLTTLPPLTKHWGKGLSSFAAGVLLATATMHLLPEVIEEGLAPEHIGASLLGAMLFFFLLERTAFWFHHHHPTEVKKPLLWRVVLGDGLHNLIDGVAIAAATAADPRLGILTAVAITAHELPQELADFSLLLQTGMHKFKALLWNGASALTAFFGVFIGLFLHEQAAFWLPVGLAITSGMFLYIALSDVIPDLHDHARTHGRSTNISQVVLLMLGVVTLIGVNILTHSYLPTSH